MSRGPRKNPSAAPIHSERSASSPTTWLITFNGSGSANDVFRSVRPYPAKPSISRCACSRIHGSYRASRRGMKKVLTAARSRS
jgi:hypothetical protein